MTALPNLPKTPTNSTGLLAYFVGLTRTLQQSLSQLAMRLNSAAQKDGSVAMTGPLKTLTATVAELPTASAAGAGGIATVTDATSTAFGSTVSGGGSNTVPVHSDGTSWRVG